MARASRAYAGRLDRHDAVLRHDAAGSRRATQPLAVTRTRKSASSAIVSAMRAAVGGATLILTVLGGPGLAACAGFSRAPTETPPAPAAQAIATSPQGTVLPRVRLVATGGTISNRTGGRLTAEDLVNSMPGIERYVRPEFEQFANIASGSLTVRQWIDLANRINTLFTEDTELAGVVVTSGTDTLEETAYFLDLTIHTDKPVVIVGSMRNPSTLGYEGAANLLQGYRVAGDPTSRGKGVLVVLNDEINSAREVTKTDAHRLQTFQSRDYGFLGVVDADRVVYYRDVVKRHTGKSEFDVSRLEELPRVDIVMTYQGATGDIIKAVVDQGTRGIVIAAAGAGATSGTQNEGIRYATEKGVFVVITTRTGGGRIASSRMSSKSRLQIQGEDLAPVKARILLMLALTRTKDAADIQRMFTEY
jgi:L-asparaginase